ncbi:MAG: PAS domain S-box protein, partial [Anaerolineales bacterium]
MPNKRSKRQSSSSLLQNLETFLQHQNKPMWIQDLNNQTFLAVNDAALELCGYCREEFLQQRVTDILVEEEPASQTSRKSKWEVAYNGFQVYRLLRKDHTSIEIEVTLHKIQNEGNETALAIAQEICLHNAPNRLLRTLDRAALKMEQALTTEEVFQAVAKELKSAGYICTVFLCDEKQEWLYPSYHSYDSEIMQTIEKLAGIKLASFAIPLQNSAHFYRVIREREIVFLENPQAVIHEWLPPSLKMLSKPISQLLNAPKSILAPLHVEGKTIGSFSVTAVDLTAEDVPAVTAFASLIAAGWQRAKLCELAQGEINRRKQAEQTLQHREAQLRAVIEQVPAVIYTESAKDGRLLFISPQVEKLTGYTAAEWQGKAKFWVEVIHPDDLQAVIKADEETGITGEPFCQEYRILTRDGRVVWIYDEAVLIRDGAGEPLYWQGIMLDISQQKFHEKEMEALAQLSQTLGKSLDLTSLLKEILNAAIHAIAAAEKGTILLADENGKLKICAVQGYDDPRVWSAAFPLDSGYSARAYRQKRAQIIEDARADPEIRYDGEISEMANIHSAIVAPLVVHEEAIGVISLDNVNRKQAFSEHDLRLLESFAMTAALVIERARFFEEIERRSSYNAALNDILIYAGRVSNDLDGLLKATLDAVLTTLNLSMGAVWLS